MPPSDSSSTLHMQSDPNRVWQVTLDDQQTFTVHPGRVTPRQAREFRIASEGAMTVLLLMDLVTSSGVGPEEIAALVWLGDRQTGSGRLTWEAAEDLVADATDVRIDFDAAPESDDPES